MFPTLKPGGSALIELPPFPAHVQRKLDAGALLCIAEGPITRVARGRFKREMEIYLDSEKEGLFILEWEESEPWYLYLVRRCGFSRKDDGLTLGDYWTQKGPR
jgi:hypothetical protein